MPNKVLITGGSGLVGSLLNNELVKKKYQVHNLTTSAVKAETDNFFYWNIKDQYIDAKAFEGVDAVIHLAGAGVADSKWTKKRKQEILDSRVKGTALLASHLHNRNITNVVAASAVGYYGMDSGEELMNEDSPLGQGFLAEVVDAWEKEIEALADVSDHIAVLRIGVVLSMAGGALAKMLTPFKFGIGSPLGSGKQYMSWIHIQDLVNMMVYCLEQNISGTYNAVAPSPQTNKDFSKEVASVLKKPFFLPSVPSFVLKMIFGEMAQIVLGGNNVSSKKIEKQGYQFEYSDLNSALHNLLKK